MIRVLNKFEPNPYGGVEVDTTSRGGFKDLSPFYLGPYKWIENVGLDDTPFGMIALNVENLWQYSKVYQQHITGTGNIDPAFFDWRAGGFNKVKADRYPMGKGAKPAFSYWQGEHLDYVTARKKIYIPAYRDLVLQTNSYAMLYQWVMEGRDIILRDFDGYDHVKMGMTLADVVNNPKKSMGHAFIIAGLLTGQINSML